MAHAGQLVADKIAGRWLIDRASLERRNDSVVVDGRPYSPANAWALLCLAEDRRVDWVSPSALSRLRGKLKSHGLLDLAPRLRSRAAAMELRAHPSALSHIVLEPGVLKAGASAAQDFGIDIQAGEEVEAYVARNVVNDIVAKYHLAPSDRPNVLLRVVEDNVDPAWRSSIGAAVVAIDLFESEEPRSQRAARRFLERLDRGVRQGVADSAARTG